METRFYEGCGREGPIRCIFLCEFHPIAGPKVSCQFPDEYISKEIFDAINVYIIPKPPLQRCLMTINALGHKIIGYPVRIENPRYERNAYMFNLCFVCDTWARTVQYEPVVKKLAEHLTTMEEENRFLSDAAVGGAKLPTILAHLLYDLNTHKTASIVEGETMMHLKVVEVWQEVPLVRDHDVPVFLKPLEHESNWDLTTTQVLPYIDGYNHISKIASETDVEITLVKSCIQNLVYYGVVSLVPILKYSNMYRGTPGLSRLFKDVNLQKECINYVASGTILPSIRDVLQIYCNLLQGSTLKSVCARFAPNVKCIDERKLIIFGLLHKLIKCLRKYPIYVRDPAEGDKSPDGLRRLFTGTLCIDRICCLANMDLVQLEHIIENDPDVTVVWR
ncbi:GATOR complex protein NPRL2-like isoform X2 [Arctopsyche grandis]|uniref:GATOR complex protein NPRL2-like isoform X2 n=1 Tax=Arctopsyche grandis TaxID=121162 RepID=UPI00406D63D8